MAKKTSRNAVKKIDNQIGEIVSSNNGTRRSSTTKINTVRKDINKTSSSTRSRSSNVRENVIIPTEKKEPIKKKTTTPSKNVRGEVIVTPKRARTTTKKTSTSRNVRGEVVVVPTQSKTSTTKKVTSKKNTTKRTTKKKNDNVINAVQLDHNVEAIINDIENQEKNIEDKYADINIIEDNISDAIENSIIETTESIASDVESNENKIIDIKDNENINNNIDNNIIEEYVIDDININENIINDVDGNNVSVTTKSVNNNIEDKINNSISNKSVVNKKKFLTTKEYEDLKLDKPIDLENFDKLDNYKIISEFEEDIYKDRDKSNLKENKKNKPLFGFKKKRKYIIDTPKNTSYHELESDLRSLYDKVNDVVSDFGYDDTLRENRVEKNTSSVNNTFKKRTLPKNPLKKKPPINIIDDSTKIKEKEIEIDTKPEKKILLDYINQKVLNFFLIVLLIIFTGMTIAFIWFLIYVSTF